MSRKNLSMNQRESVKIGFRASSKAKRHRPVNRPFFRDQDSKISGKVKRDRHLLLHFLVSRLIIGRKKFGVKVWPV